MINLPPAVLIALEKVVAAEDEFVTILQGISVAGSGRIVVPSANLLPMHSALLLHIVANLVELQTKVLQLEGQLTILKEDLDGDGTDAEGN